MRRLKEEVHSQWNIIKISYSDESVITVMVRFPFVICEINFRKIAFPQNVNGMVKRRSCFDL